MERLSDKAILKDLMRDAGLTVIPGTQTLPSISDARSAAAALGYPVMLKACAGGGGRGIRLIRSEEELEEAWLQATAEEMRLSILGKDSKTKDEKPLGVVDAYVKENTTELVDPLDARKKTEALKEKRNTLLTELDTQIKVSNATTFIEV